MISKTPESLYLSLHVFSLVICSESCLRGPKIELYTPSIPYFNHTKAMEINVVVYIESLAKL